MNSKKISVIFPTRERPGLLNNILTTLIAQAHDMDQVEILVAYDEDDETTKRFILEHIDLPVIWTECARSLNFSRDYYSRLAKTARGRWLLICNDDVEFMTKNWDVLLDSAMTQAVGDGPDIMYGWVEDNLGAARMTQFNDYTCFPVLGKAGVEAMGCVFPDRLPTWGADIWIRHVYGQIDRMVKIPIEVRHICHHNGTREQDAINRRIQSNQVPIDIHPTHEEINRLSYVLRKAAHV